MAELISHFLLGEIHMPQYSIRPGIGAMENHNLVSRVENDISAAGNRLLIVPHDALSDGADLLKASVHGHLNGQREQRFQLLHGSVLFLGRGNPGLANVQLHAGFLLRDLA